MLPWKVGYKDWHIVTIVMNLQVANSDLEHNIVILLPNFMMLDSKMCLVPVSRLVDVMDDLVDAILLFVLIFLLIVMNHLLP